MKSALMPLGFVAALALIVVLAFSFFPGKPCPAGCNVILIMMDTLSARHIGTYGYNRNTMPLTTAFFEKGAIFENAQSNAPWTLPSFNSMYFSDLPSRITYADLENGTRPTLPDEVRESGATVRAVVAGLDNFIFDGITRRYKPEELRDLHQTAPFILAGKELPELLESGERFFFLVHSFEAHDPYQPSKPFNTYYEETEEYPVVTRKDLLDEYDGRQPNAEKVDVFELRYDQQIAQTDERVAHFLNSIPTAALANTVIILTSDHGEAFGEHTFLFHANSLFQEELHIPLMMRVPGVSARRIAEPVSLLDMTPTILSLMGIEPSPEFLGKDLSPLLKGGSLGERTIPFMQGKPFYFGAEMPSRTFVSVEDTGALGVDRPIVGTFSYGVRIGSQKAFEQNHPPLNAGLHWYDLSNDPDEKNNLANGAPLPENLQRELDALKAEFTP